MTHVLRDALLLYVDDEGPNRVVFDACFSDLCRIRSVCSGQEAIEVLEQVPVDVLVTDFSMPGMDGIELCAAVRARHPGVRRVLVTAYSDASTATDAINRGGVDRYVAKPWSIDEVKLLLAEELAHARIGHLTRRLQEALVQRERHLASSTTWGQVIHDLGNFAAALTMSSSELNALAAELRDSLPDEAHEELVEQVEVVDTCAVQIKALHGRARQGHEHFPEREHLLLVDAFASVRQLTAARFGRALSLETDCPEDVAVHADPTDVGRILVNLVTNAAQAIEESRRGQRIHLSAVAFEDEVLITVADDGPGMPVAVAERAFQTAFTTRAQRGGSGLGLPICKRLAEANGGGLELRDTREDGGTCFELRLVCSGAAAAVDEDRLAGTG